MTDRELNDAIVILDSGIDQVNAAIETMEHERTKLEERRHKLRAMQIMRNWDKLYASGALPRREER